MTREELFEFINKIDDPKKDHSKILSNLHYTHFYLMDRYKKLLAGYDLTPIQSNVLGIITFFYPKTASLEEIKEMVLEPNSDVSRTVSRLVEKGFVEKVINKENKRKVAIVSTSKGMELMQKIESEKKFEKFTAQLTTAEAKTFVKVLSKLRS
jgi:DNA-binding MarR family transcriptional regulator